MHTILALILSSFAAGQFFPDEFNFNPQFSRNEWHDLSRVAPRSVDTSRESFLDALVAKLTVPELGILSLLLYIFNFNLLFFWCRFTALELIVLAQCFNCTSCLLIVSSAQILTMDYGVSNPPRVFGKELLFSTNISR